MKTIWKYPLRVEQSQIIEMPHGAELLSIQLQGDQPMLWALVDPHNSKATRAILMYGTGWEMPGGMSLQLIYIDTVQIGALVWHYFDRP